MKTIRIFIRPCFSVTIVWLICLGLTASALRAQTFTGQPMLTEPPVSLRTIITPVPNSSEIRIRFENTGHGLVHLYIRDKKGYVLFDEIQPKRRYAGQFDMASLPIGLYTIELCTGDARHVQTVRVESPVAGHVVAVSEPLVDEKLIVNQ